MPMKKSRFCRVPVLLLCLGLLSGCGGEAGAPNNSPSGSAEPPTQSAEPSDPPEENNPELTPPAPAVEDGSWKDILRAIPYYGNAETCAMTADQALAYAQLLANGIAGKVSEGSLYSGVVDSNVIFWDTPCTAWGYSGEYQTDRANAILGDFAGDGQPYVCVLSSDHPDCGFDVYFSDGGAADFVYGDETYGGRQYTTFGLDADGKMTLYTGGPGSATSHYAEWLALSGREAKTLHSWSEVLDYETNLMHVIVDGEESVYTLEEWGNLEPLDWDELPNTPYTPIPLREMIAYLNQYAAARGSDRAVTVEDQAG